jgi:hypothetical protein
MKRHVEEGRSLRKAAPHAGKPLLRLNVVGTRVGLQPHAVSQAGAAVFMRSERGAPGLFGVTALPRPLTARRIRQKACARGSRILKRTEVI